ncbi:MAG: WD40 repeat domain-containing serine/threonine protein kinase [Gemmataceae bacterium]
MANTEVPAPALSDDSWLRREDVLRRFEDAWRTGPRPNIDDFLYDDDISLHIELVHLDIEYRQKNGEDPSFSEYKARYPQLAREQPDTLNDSPSSAQISARPSIPGYEVLEELGRGGMGVVFRARQIALDRFVALKVLRTTHEPTHIELTRLRTEAAAIGRLQHPNIVQIYDVGDTNGRPYLAMELVAGSNLMERIKDGPLSCRDAARLVETLADAIHHAHTRGIVHRDLTPGNILLADEHANSDAPSLTPKITDFGLAKLLVSDGVEQTQTGAILGTPSYMAPEQAKGLVRLVGPGTDVYGLGAVLFAALTGRPPFRGDSTWETTRRVIEEAPPSLSKLAVSVPRDLETICQKCLAKELFQRYSSAKDLADDLRRFLNGQPITARRVGTVERLRLWARRNPALAVTTVVALFLVLLTAGIGLAQVLVERDRFRAQRDRAEANLFLSLISEARAQIKARDTGWWRSAMDSLRRAAELSVSDHQTAELRDLTVECLSTPYPCFHLEGTWTGHTGRVSATAISPDGHMAATAATDKTVRVWSIPDGRCLAVLTGHTDNIKCVAFDSTGPRLASGCADGTVRSWSVGQNRGLIHEVDLHAGAVNAIAYEPGTSTLAAGCHDGSVYLIENSTAEPRRLASAEAEIASLAYQPRHSALAIGTGDLFLRLIDLKTGNELHREKVYNRPWSISFNSQGTSLAMCDPETFGYGVYAVEPTWALYGGQNLLHTNSAVHVASVEQIGHERNAYWLTASLDGVIRLSSTNIRSVVMEVAVARGDYGPIRSAAVGGNGSWVVAGYYNGQVRLWSLTVPEQRALVYRHGAPNVAFVGSSHRLARSPNLSDFSADMNSQPKVFSPPFNAEGSLWGFAASNDGRWLLEGLNEGRVRVRDTQTLDVTRTIEAHDAMVWCAAFSSDSKFAATGAGDIKIWDTNDWHEVRSIKLPGDVLVRAVAFHPHRPWLVAVIQDRTIRAWDLTTGEPIGEPVLMESESLSVAFRPDGKRLAATNFDQLVRVWDLPEQSWTAAEPTWRLKGHNAEVWAATYSPDGRWLATGSGDGVILMDADTHARLVRLRGPDGQIRSVSFSADCQLLAAACYVKPTIVWNMPRVRQTLAEMGLDW